MKIAIIGYGRMGQEIEKRAVRRGHEITLIVDKENSSDLCNDKLQGTDVAIEFSFPSTAFDNITTCIKSGIPVVSGTTGWLDRYNEVVSLCNEAGGTFIYASNFSIGVNILFHLNKRLASVMKEFEQYNPTVEEIHHIKKKDAPSGTAITIATDIIVESERFERWVSGHPGSSEGEIPLFSKRVGDVPGNHTVIWSSETDSLTISHEAFSREGFALGAVFAAEFIQNKKGIYSMKDMLGF
ncbi:MAG: 4-hydroxy-tetrahydrodipicolinate reductase [Bacteroidales bacterium]|nr:4-hydroxy-tetrahydrodipicolinate reductase [Bacteroidales bacterium]